MTLLPNYYYTFVDVMEFKDLTNEVVTSLATSQFHLDIVSSLWHSLMNEVQWCTINQSIKLLCHLPGAAMYIYGKH